MIKNTVVQAVALASVMALPAFADGHASVQGYALTEDGKSLLVMADVMAGDPSATLSLSKAVSAIAWRPVTGELLGFANGGIYTIDTTSGIMSDLGATFLEDTDIAADAAIAFDFNNKIDAVRAVSSDGDNLVYFPKGFGDNDERAGSVRRFTGLAYEDGDSMAGKTPAVFANAYTNAIPGAKASDTFQYALDAETDALISLANNAGTLATIAPITVDGKAVDLMPTGGFDIVSSAEGENQAYAVLQMAGADKAGLYEIDLESGAATKLTALPAGNIAGFAAHIGG